jgi:5-methylcytosine-specific restriction endonuclease McrA
MNRQYANVAERARNRCEYRHAPEAIFNLPFEVEHIVPTSRGEPDDESNLALTCRACNLYKSDQQGGVDETTREVVRLFHPRRDRWDEPCRVEPDDDAIRA